MDTISGLITHINLESVPISTPKPAPPSSKSNSTAREQPDITNTHNGLMSSINALRNFSTALSSFISRYDELHNHLNFINSSIDSQLPNHLVDTTNPNQPALTHLLEFACDQTVAGFPEFTVSAQNPKETASDCERRHEETDTSKNPEAIDVSENLIETDASKKPEEAVPEASCDQTTTAVAEAIVSEEYPNGMAANCEHRHENVRTPENLEEIDVFKKPEQADILNTPEQSNILPEQTDICKNPEEIDVQQKPEETDTWMDTEEVDNWETLEEIDVLKILEEIDESKNHVAMDTSKKLEETVQETWCDDQTITAATEAIVSEQNPNEMVGNCEQRHENVRTPESLEEIDVWKTPAVMDVSKKPEQTDICKNLEEIDVPQKPEDVYTPINPEETNISKKHEETGTCKKSVVSALVSFCRGMNYRGMRWHVATHISEMINLREEIAKALKFAKDPARLVRCVMGRFFIHDSREFCKDWGSHQNKQNAGRLASVLILECFLMISSDDGIEITKNDRECAAKDAAIWRSRMIKEGGFGHTDEVDARGLLLFISGFGIQDHVFKIQDIVDLLRASNVKGISAALRRSVFLIPKIPEVISWMVKSNLETEAVDMAYTFGLEDMSHPRNILKKLEEIDESKNCVASMNLEETDISRTHEETGTCKKDKITGASKKSVVSKLQSICRRMNYRGMRRYVATHLSEMINLREEIAKALKLAKDPAKLVQYGIGRFFVQDSREFSKASGSHLNKQNAIRLAAVLILECFLMISSDDGIEITNKDRESAANDAAIWRRRMIKEGGFGNTDEVDARGLLLFISGFGIQDHIFKIQDIVDLIRASNVKGISAALRRSVFLIPKIPEVINWMMKSNLEVEAVDMAYTFGLEDMCHPRNILKKLEEIDESKNCVATATSKKPEETVPETWCDDQTITAVAEAIVSEQNPNGMAANCEEQRRENVRTPESFEEIGVWKNPAIMDVSKKPEQTDIMSDPQEIDILKKPEQTDICKNPEEIDLLQKPEKNYTSMNLEETDISKKHEETGTCKKDKETGSSKKSVISILESFCQSMSFKKMKRHVATHFSEMINLREEIAKALKLAKNPAKFVLDSIGRFFLQGSRTFCKDSGSHQNEQNAARLASVLILECFVMISSDDGIEIAKCDRECAAEDAVLWRNRMIREGGIGHGDEVDARGLLLLISGFGIQDHVFKIQDIVDLIRVSNVKGISAALRRSVFLIPKIPEVIYLMVKNSLVIEAVDLAYTFELEEACHPRTIVTTYLNNKIRDIQSGSPFQMLDAVKQQLSDLKSIKQCLEYHNVDTSVLLPDCKINEKIQNLEKEVNEWKLLQKRKCSENPIHQEAKRACFSHENMPRQQNPIDHYDMNRFNQSTQPSTSYFDSDQNLGNSYTTNHSASPVYNASAMPGIIPGPVPNGLAGGLPSSYNQPVHPAEVQPYGWHGPYDQEHYLRHGQTYDSQPYYGPWGRVQLESFPGFPGRSGPSSDLYSFADIVEKECMR